MSYHEDTIRELAKQEEILADKLLAMTLMTKTELVTRAWKGYKSSDDMDKMLKYVYIGIIEASHEIDNTMNYFCSNRDSYTHGKTLWSKAL